VQPDHELLALADADVLSACGDIGFGLGDEAVALGLDVVPDLKVGEELSEREHGVPLGVHVGERCPELAETDDRNVHQLGASASTSRCQPSRRSSDRKIDLGIQRK